MNIDMSQFFQVFFDETSELLEEMERLLLRVDVESPDMEDIDAIFRAAHSIKGGAATFGLNDMTEVTHILETLLDMIRKKDIALTVDHVDAFLNAKDVLIMLRNVHRNGAQTDAAAFSEVITRLQALANEASAQVGAAPASVPVHASTTAPVPAAPVQSAPLSSSVSAAPSKPAGKTTRLLRIELPEVSLKDVDALAVELALLGKLEQIRQDDGNRGFMLDTPESNDDILAVCSFILDPDTIKITEGDGASDPSQTDGAAAQADDLGYGFFEPMSELEAQQASEASPVAATIVAPPSAGVASVQKPASRPAVERAVQQQDSTSIRVGVEKVDQLINLVGELVITQAMVVQRISQLDPMEYEHLVLSVNQLTRNTRDLQEAVMSIRMMPMDYVFSRFPRMVRDLAQKLGKKVEFVTHGAATELDKGLIERIIDPLTHLVRNSVDHGIELPDARAASGKNEAGRLLLSAAHQGGNIVIEVTDDGGGLNRERILAKAIEKGLPVYETMSDADVWQLIFAPGFSTAAAVTDVSGRGVGMDVVKRNITAMGGVVDIRSMPSKGTTISISLPLTLAILDGMLIKVGDEIYILPLGYVVESLKPDESDVREIAGNAKVIKVRGEYLQLIALHQVFNIVPRYTTPAEGMIVILESDGTRSALFIDEMLGQQQVVVKNLETNYRRVHGVSGATILGDGGVALILDVAALVRSQR
ncbi:MAG: chemotaxis protein CheA [Oxalobacter sp.]|nr:MAG: chemotaxis protein CheA [Oxalobacter sp.]